MNVRWRDDFLSAAELSFYRVLASAMSNRGTICPNKFGRHFLRAEMGNRGVVHTLGRQAIPMVWDFVETNPLNLSSASWSNMMDYLQRALEPLLVISHLGTAQMADAGHHPLFDDYAAAFITDPPYHDSVPYADLSDYFYVWLKRALPHDLGFKEMLTPKEQECIVDEVKGKDEACFEKKWGKRWQTGGEFYPLLASV